MKPPGADRRNMAADRKAADILSRAAAGGFADVFREETAASAVVFDGGRIESAGETRDCGAGLRIELPGRTIFFHADRPDAKTIIGKARELSALAGKTAAAPPPGKTANPAPPAPGKPSFHTLREKARLARELDLIARSVDPRVVQVRVSYRDYKRYARITGGSGPEIEIHGRGIYISITVTATDGRETQTGYESIGGTAGTEIFLSERPEEMARTAAMRAVTMLGARRAPAGTMPVVLSSSAGGTMIHEAVGHGLEADLAHAGHSIYAGKTGLKVASPLITVVDDPTLQGKNGSYETDDEGEPAGRTVLIEKGILKGYLHSRKTALETGLKPTGNGRRETFRDPPIPRMSNTLILPGPHDPADIIKDTPSGLYVTRMGGGQVDTVSGDFVFEIAESFMIRNGIIAEPVRNATLTGNGPEVLNSIDRLGTDLGFGVGTCGKDGQGAPVADAQPTLRIPSITVGGF